MKEFDEQEAVNLMAAASGMEQSEELEDALYEILDLIYDYYDENDNDDIDADDDPVEIAKYVANKLAKNGPAINFATAQLQAIVKAEIDYELSLL